MRLDLWGIVDFLSFPVLLFGRADMDGRTRRRHSSFTFTLRRFLLAAPCTTLPLIGTLPAATFERSILLSKTFHLLAATAIALKAKTKS